MLYSFTAVTVNRTGKWNGNIVTVGANSIIAGFERLTQELSKNSSRRQALMHWDSQDCPVIVNRNTEVVITMKHVGG